MWLRVEHTTSFTYDGPITEAYTELRMKPLDAGGQRCSSFRLRTEPVGSAARSHHDHYGNEVLRFDVLEPHERLVVTASADVYTPPAYAETTSELTLNEEHDYLMPTAYVPLDGAVAELGAALPARGSTWERAHALMSAVAGELTYERGATTVRTTADEVLALGRGVCQDFAHVFLGACRSRGIPARYVSGYLYDEALEGGHAASHAWVDVWSEEQGWISLDPTHDRAQTDHYVRVAVGRDYADVPPTRGIYRGSAQEELDVTVAMTAI
jgi:transglutaminase-like putative cysteine protease